MIGGGRSAGNPVGPGSGPAAVPAGDSTPGEKMSADADAPASVPARRGPVRRGALPAAGVAAAALLAVACAPDGGGAGPGGGDGDGAPGSPLVPDLASHTWLPGQPEAGASPAFWDHWGDGRAEMSGYRVSVPRYGETRDGRLVLIYVTEPHDRRRWIKDDGAADPHRVEVMKLNAALEFRTGVYPYTAMTSVFAPVADWGRERFSPVKLAASVQEWCGSWRLQAWPGDGGFRSLRLSYFAGEGERTREVDAPEDLLWEDALLIQLRELDGPFAGGGDWSGHVVPSLWRLRAGHAEARPVPATITRTDAERDGIPVTRFVLEYGDYRRTYDVEKSPPGRVLGWSTSEGAEAELLDTERMAYWRLNAEGDGSARARLGLDAGDDGGPAPDAAGPPSGACGGP